MDYDDGRHFPNTLNDAEDLFDAEAVRRVREYLAQASERCAAKQTRKDPSIYTGESGAALMFVKLAIAQEGGDPPALLGQALERLARCEPHFGSRRVVTFAEGVAGALAVKAAALHLQGQAAAAQACCGDVLRLAASAQALPPGECEMLYGRCGYLHCLMFLRKVFCDPQLGTREAVAIVHQVVQQGLAQAKDDLPMYYEWHGKCYYGAAHGLCGILHTLLNFPAEIASLDSSAEVLSGIRHTVDVLMKRRFPSGNMPSSWGNATDKLVQWCHGAPGFVSLLLRCAEVFAEPKFNQLAIELGEVVWMRGLLYKGTGLCHGISGNGYAQLALYRATMDPKHLRRAQQFLLFSLQHSAQLSHVPDHPYSLFEGRMGSVCFAADVLHPDVSFFPGYEA